MRPVDGLARLLLFLAMMTYVECQCNSTCDQTSSLCIPCTTISSCNATTTTLRTTTPVTTTVRTTTKVTTAATTQITSTPTLTSSPSQSSTVTTRATTASASVATVSSTKLGTETPAITNPASSSSNCNISNTMPATLQSSAVCPNNCTLTEWTSWSSCNASCGTGLMTRNRTIDTPAEWGGNCTESLNDTKECEVEAPCHIYSTGCPSTTTSTSTTMTASTTSSRPRSVISTCESTTTVSSSTATPKSTTVSTTAKTTVATTVTTPTSKPTTALTTTKTTTLLTTSQTSTSTSTLTTSTSTMPTTSTTVTTTKSTTVPATTSTAVSTSASTSTSTTSTQKATTTSTSTIPLTTTSSSTTKMTTQSTIPPSTTSSTRPPSTTTSSEAHLFALLKDLGIDPSWLSDSVGITSAITDAIPFIMAELTDEQQASLFVTLEDSINNCQYDGRPCDMVGEWTTEVNPQYGNCFTFNYKNPPLEASTYGHQRGLHMILKGSKDEQACNSASSGFILQIHDPGEPSLPDTYGHYITPGYNTGFAFRKIEISKLKEPYGECTKTKDEVAQYYYPGSYVAETCLRSCYQKRVNDTCKCFDPRYIVPKPPKDNYTKPCKTEKKPCVDQIAKCEPNLVKSLGCKCPDACESVIYLSARSTTTLENDLEIVQSEESCQEHCKNGTWSKKLNAIIHVYFEKQYAMSYTETPMFTIISWLYNVSNLPQMFTGFCMNVVFEFLGLVIQLVLGDRV